MFHFRCRFGSTAATQASLMSLRALVAVSVIMIISRDRCAANEQQQHTNKYKTCSTLEYLLMSSLISIKRCGVMVDSSHVDTHSWTDKDSGLYKARYTLVLQLIEASCCYQYLNTVNFCLKSNKSNKMFSAQYTVL